MNMARKQSPLVRLGAIALTSLALTAAGCVSYANWPPVPDDTALNDPNNPATEQVMMAGLRWAVNKFPPEGDAIPADRPPTNPQRSVFARGQEQQIQVPARAAVNLPQGVKPAVYRRVANYAGGLNPAGTRYDGGRGGVVPLTAETANLPTYHIGFVRIRGDEAVVTVFRPVVSMGGQPMASATYQEIKLGLRGGLRDWSVDSIRPYGLGGRPAPETNFYVPEPPPGVRAAPTTDRVDLPPPAESKPVMREVEPPVQNSSGQPVQPIAQPVAVPATQPAAEPTPEPNFDPIPPPQDPPAFDPSSIDPK